jgi:DNA-binding HxlR family transcriptional regulator
MESSALRRQLQELSPEQLRALLSASGHEQLLRREEEDKKPVQVDAQLAQEAKDEGNALFRRGRMQDAVAAYSRYRGHCCHSICSMY